MKVRIREATREDCEEILRLKLELAEHRKMQGRPMLSCQELMRDGFESNPPYFKCLLAEGVPEGHEEGQCPQIMGYALYFYSYAAFEGKSLHLEDLIAAKRFRGQGVGSKLMKALAQICLDENLARITLEVLDWNESAISFYEKHYGYNSTKVDNWVAYSFEREALLNLTKS